MTPAAAHLLTRHSHRRPGPGPLRVLPDLAFERGRVHEICGASRRVLALATGGATTGPVLWIRPAWEPARINPEGMLRLIDPGRLIFLDAVREEDLLWSMEEALRAGILALVVTEVPRPPGLTPVRRLHLAAERGVEAGGAPLGLLLTPGEGGAAGIETRWSFTPDHAPGGVEAWRLTRLRARALPPATFRVTGTPKGLAQDSRQTQPA